MAQLKQLAIKLGTEGPVKVVSTPRVVKLLFNGAYIVQTTEARFVWEHPFFPQYYVPRSTLEHSARQGRVTITDDERFESDAGQTVGRRLVLRVGDKSTSNVVAFADHLAGPAAALNGLVKVDFASIDQWFEEDTPIFVHPKDPFKRIDVLQSTRHIRVSVGGKVVADTTTSQHLHETGLPPRYYLPLTAVDASVLRPSATRTQCPYKGEAEYYSVEVDGTLYEDIVWYYNRPILESALITGLVAFYNEKVDIEIDGVKLERPQTHFGKPSEKKLPSAV